MSLTPGSCCLFLPSLPTEPHQEPHPRLQALLPVMALEPWNGILVVISHLPAPISPRFCTAVWAKQEPPSLPLPGVLRVLVLLPETQSASLISCWLCPSPYPDPRCRNQSSCLSCCPGSPGCNKPRPRPCWRRGARRCAWPSSWSCWGPFGVTDQPGQVSLQIPGMNVSQRELWESQ